MPYEIKKVKSLGTGDYIVAKGTDGQVRYYPKSTVDALIGEAIRRGVTNRYVIAGILATIGKESGFKIQPENMNYTAKRLLEIPGWASKFSDDKIDPTTGSKINVNDYDRKPEKIANYIYGGQWGPVKKDKNRQEKKWYWGLYGNSQIGDGFKYRGRGYNGITFKSGYEKKEKYIPGLVQNPDLMLNERNSSVTAIAYYVDGDFKNKKLLKSKFNVSSANDFNNWDQALLCICNMTAGFGYDTKAENVQWAFQNAKKVHGFLIEYLEKNPEGTVLPPESPAGATASPTTDAQTQQQNDIASQDQGPSGETSNNNSSSGAPVTNLTQFFKPTLVPTDITIALDGLSDSDKEKVSKEIGYLPFLYVNGTEIKVRYIDKFKLYHKGILPVLETTFIDSFGLLKSDGIPKDDSKVTIYINSRSKNLRSIQMDFKVYNFKDNGSNSYTIVGICDIPEMYIRKFKSYKSKTSHEALQELAKECGLGFSSNIQNSDDKMTWLNTGFRNMEFVDNIMLNSYVSDQSFQTCYIDYYYNLCYVDLNKELLRDVSQDQMINAFGSKYKDGKGENEKDEEVTKLLLGTDKSLKSSISFIEKFDIINKSTKVSIKKSYRTKTKYYDTVKKELLVFDVESQTSDGSKSIILKGDPNDNNFFENNTNFYYSGKIDSFDDGQGNVHKNYNYSISQNRQNLDDITKFSAKFYLPNSNHNLYVYQKVPVIFSMDKPNPASPDMVLKRLTGDWLITDIEISYISGKQYQIVSAVLRELSLIAGEESKSKSRANKGENNQKQSTNELAPGDAAGGGGAVEGSGTTTTNNVLDTTDPTKFVGPDWKNFDVNRAVQEIQNTKYKPNKKFSDSLKQVLAWLKNDSKITDMRQAAYLLGTAYAESGYSLQRWESDFACTGAGIPYGENGPCQSAINYYKSTNGKKNYYTLGVDSKGFPYFGRGLIQLTGKDNYEKYGKKIGVDLVRNADLAMIPSNSYNIAVTYMIERNTFKKAIDGNLTGARKSVNGGTKGIDEVNSAYKEWLAIFDKIKPSGTNNVT